MPVSHSPTVRRRRLGAELRRLREEAKLSAQALAKQINTSQTKLSQAENARRGLKDMELEKLFAELGVSEDKAAELRQLHEQAAEPGWWDPDADLLTDSLELLIGLEAGATCIRRYDEGFVPALVQTEQYAKAIIEAAGPFQRSGDVQRLVDFRMRRQQRLHDSDFELTMIINEGVLWRQIGGVDVMREQLLHLARGEFHAHVDIHVVPFTAGAHPAQGQTLAVMTFTDEDDPDAVFVDYGHTSGVLERPSEMRPLTNAFAGTVQASMSTEDSRTRIEHIAEKLGTSPE